MLFICYLLYPQNLDNNIGYSLSNVYNNINLKQNKNTTISSGNINDFTNHKGFINIDKLAISPSPNVVPYENDNFNEVLFYLRRGEVIMLGAFPFFYLIVSLIYDSIKYISGLSKKDSNAYKYMPFSPSKVHDIKDEGIVIGVSLGLSLVVAIIDSILVSKEVKRLKNKGDNYDYFNKN